MSFTLKQAIILAGAILPKDGHAPILEYVKIDSTGVWATDRFMVIHVPAESINSDMPDTDIFVSRTILPVLKKSQAVTVSNSGLIDVANEMRLDSAVQGDYPNLSKLTSGFLDEDEKESSAVSYRLDLLSRIKPTLWGDKANSVVKWIRRGKVLVLGNSMFTLIYMEPR